MLSSSWIYSITTSFCRHEYRIYYKPSNGASDESLSCLSSRYNETSWAPGWAILRKVLCIILINLTVTFYRNRIIMFNWERFMRTYLIIGQNKSSQKAFLACFKEIIHYQIEVANIKKSIRVLQDIAGGTVQLNFMPNSLLSTNWCVENFITFDTTK